MKTYLLSVFVFLVLNTAPAWAHFEIGRYIGYTTEGAVCAFEIRGVSFKNNVKHPLNEQVFISIDFLNLGKIIFSHLAQVDLVKKTVRPKQEVLSSVVPNSDGAMAIEMEMNEFGPMRMVMIKDYYNTPEKNVKIVCEDLVKM